MGVVTVAAVVNVDPLTYVERLKEKLAQDQRISDFKGFSVLHGADDPSALRIELNWKSLESARRNLADATSIIESGGSATLVGQAELMSHAAPKARPSKA